MKINPLQIERYKYQPKLPASLIEGVEMIEGDKTNSVADQSEIEKLFPNTYGMPIIRFEKGSDKFYQEINVGGI